MPAIDRFETGATGSRFLFVRPLRWAIALAGIVFAAAAPAAEYRDTAGAFTMLYDPAIWIVKPEGDTDFSIACTSDACAGSNAGCSGSRLWVPLASVRRLTREFDAKDTERAVMTGLASQKASADKARAEPEADDVVPEVVKPYKLMHTREGHPVYDSEYRTALGGRVTRFLSFSTAARSYSIAIVCHVPEDRLEVWRPRFDALIEGFRPAPEPFWLRWLAHLGL